MSDMGTTIRARDFLCSRLRQTNQVLFPSVNKSAFDAAQTDFAEKLPLVGLDPQREEVARFLRAVRETPGAESSLLLVGAHGSGKTAILSTAFADVFTSSPASYVAGSVSQTSTPPPFTLVFVDGEAASDAVALREISSQLALVPDDAAFTHQINATGHGEYDNSGEAHGVFSARDEQSSLQETATSSWPLLKQAVEARISRSLRLDATRRSSYASCFAASVLAPSASVDRSASPISSSILRDSGPRSSLERRGLHLLASKSDGRSRGVAGTLLANFARSRQIFHNTESSLIESGAKFSTIGGSKVASSREGGGTARLGYEQHLDFIVATLRSRKLAQCSAPVFVVIDNFDCFARKTRQTLLYALLDLAQSEQVMFIVLSFVFDLVILLCLIHFHFPGPHCNDRHDNSLRLR